MKEQKISIKKKVKMQEKDLRNAYETQKKIQVNMILIYKKIKRLKKKKY